MIPTDVNYLRMWPLVVAIEDCYVPELVAECLEAYEQFSDEEHAAVIHAEAYYAAGKVSRN